MTDDNGYVTFKGLTTTIFWYVAFMIVAIIFIAGMAYYLNHIWSDCLDENNVLTCMRMLNK